LHFYSNKEVATTKQGWLCATSTRQEAAVSKVSTASHQDRPIIL
jgi:hypothetical protein